MPQNCTKSEDNPSDQTVRRAFTGVGNLGKSHPRGYPSKIRNQIIAFNNPRDQIRRKAITRHSGLILDLQAIQPASLSEIAESCGQSLSSTRNHLRQLVRLDLVIKIAFEHHVLYCLNGHYNLQVRRLLEEHFE